MNTKNKHDLSEEIQNAIYEAIKPNLDELVFVRENQQKQNKRIQNYEELKIKTEQNIVDLQAAIVKGDNEDRLSDVTSLKLKLQSIDDIIKGIKKNYSELKSKEDEILNSIGNKTNSVFNTIKIQFQAQVDVEADQFLKKLEDKHAALKKNLDPRSFIPELSGGFIKNLKSSDYARWPLKLPESFSKWVFAL